MSTIKEIEQSIADCDEMTRAVRSAPPEKFTMAVYCGAAGCVIGWVDALRQSPPSRPTLSLNSHSYFADTGQHVFDVGMGLLPAITDDDSEVWANDHRCYLFGQDPGERLSELDDRPFWPTPQEIQCMGQDWAFGMADREAALSRIAIVRASLVTWLAAVKAQEPVEVGA